MIYPSDIDMVQHVTTYMDKISVKDYVDGLKQDRHTQMQFLLTDANCTRIPNRFITKQGIPFEELVRAAETEKADMVVMGTKGRGNIAGILFGSQAEKMFRHCPVPLLSIRENQERKGIGPKSPPSRPRA